MARAASASKARRAIFQPAAWPWLSVRVAVDREAGIAAESLRSVGIDRDRIRLCHDAASAQQAWEAGAFIATGSYDAVANLPVAVVVEATGEPEVGARHVRRAIEAKRHVALVSKEVDSVIGPGLAAMAREAGVIVSPVDGDQPSLLYGLVTWAEMLGLEIVCAGKSSEYDFVHDPVAGTIDCNGTVHEVPDFKGLGGNLLLGLIGVCIGLLVASVGLDPLTGTMRFTFGSLHLMSGINLIPVIIGLFAISEVLKRCQEGDIHLSTKSFTIRIFDWPVMRQIRGAVARSSILGTAIGILPGIGASTAAMVAYSETVRWSRDRSRFGKGAPEGVAAPEAANNAAAMGALVPLFALGIPGSGTTAIILGAFIVHGLTPGPTFMTGNTDLIYAVFVGLLIVNFLILVFSKPFIAVLSRLLDVPYSVLGPIIVICCIVGTYSVQNAMFDVWLMLGFGLAGFLLEKIGFPLVSIILGVVLGPIAESELRRSLAMSRGELSIFWERPISAILLVIAILLVAATVVMPLLRRLQARKAETRDA